LHDKKETCLLIDIAIPFDSNVYTKENEKLSKYKDLDDDGDDDNNINDLAVPRCNLFLSLFYAFSLLGCYVK